MSSGSSFVARIFGTFRWSPPGWLASSAGAAFTTVLLFLIASLRMLSEKPVRFFNYCFLSLAVIFGGYAGYSWYKNLPEPQLVKFTFNELQAIKPETPDAKPQKLKLQFSSPSAALNLIGKNVSINMEPAFNGKWIWLDDRNLEFEPDNEWPVAQKYSLKLDKKLFSSSVKLEKYDFSFYSPLFKVLAQSSELYQDPSDPKIRQAVLKLKFTHTADKTDLERKTSIRIKRKSQKEYGNKPENKLGFKLAFDDRTNEAFIRSETLNIPESDSEIQIHVAEGLKAAKGGTGLEKEIVSSVNIPGIENYFRISDVTEDIVTNQETHQAERIVNISSTASIRQNQLVKNTEVLLLPDDPELYELSNPVESGLEEDEYEEEEEDAAAEGCPWTNPAQIPAAAIQKASRLLVTWLENQQDPGTENAFRINADPGRCLLVNIKKGTDSFAGIPLAKEISFVVRTKEFPKEILFTDKGAILALNGERKINVLSRGIQTIQFKLYRVLPNSLHHLSQFGFNYPYSYNTPSFDYNFGPENISEVYDSKAEVADYREGKTAYNIFDFGRYLDSYPQDQRGLFILKAYGIDPKTNYQVGEAVNRLVLVSNLGFLMKQNQDKSSSLFVLSTATQQPVEAAKVEVLGKNGLPVASALTDSNGQASIPDLSGFENEKMPVTYVVSSGNDQSFMPYSLADRGLNYSRFDIGGLYSVEDEKSLQAYIFSDRGIYRPGENVKAGLIVKKLDWSPLPKDLPLEISVRDPRDREILRQKISFEPEGFKEFSYDLSNNALTGSYNLNLEIIGKQKRRTSLGQTSIRVEEFLPDRLKIDARWVSEDNKPLTAKSSGWLKPENLKAAVNLKNLYGNPADGHKLKAQIKLRPNTLIFKQYSGYNFFDPFNPYRQNATFDEDLGEISSNESGDGIFDPGLTRFEAATYGLTAIFQGFEKDGGRSVATTLTTTISPADYIIGWKSDSDLNFIKKNLSPVVNIIALDPDAEKTSVSSLKLELYESKYLSILTRQNSGNLAYQSVLKENLLQSSDLQIPAEGYDLSIFPDKPGNFIYRIKSADGKELNTIRFKVVGEADLSGSLEKNAELDVKLDRSDYPAESEVQISITAPYKGAGLITIERDKVYASKWFQTDSNSSLQTIKIPANLEGNAYINIALVRSLDSREIFANPLSYSAVPFSISRESRNQKISLGVPENMKPGSNLTISASSTEKTKALIYAVDEGILQVARYKKPEPVSHFFRKRALEVGTKQILDLLLPEFSLVKELSAAGGDEDALLGKHRNPFKRKGQKPVIYWSGLVELDNSPKDFAFSVPDYFSGAIKTFAVSVSDQKIGSAESSTLVKSDIVLQPNAPLSAAPDDEFVTSVTVANTTSADKEIKVRLETGSALQVIGENSSIVQLAAGKDRLVEFKVKALNQLGSANLKFIADDNTSYTIDLSVRPAAPRLETVKIGTLGRSALSADSSEIEISRKLFEQQAERNFSFSSLPQSLSYSLAKYLEFFPHACSEQISSQGFGLMFGEGLLEIKDANSKLSKIFQALANRQQEDGSFSLWPGGSHSASWANLHAIRLIAEAKLAGKEVNSYLLSNAERYLRDFTSETINTSDNPINQARLKAYAIYILTRLGTVSTNQLKSLSEELAQVKNWQKDITALLMAASYAQLQLDKQANELLNSFDFEIMNRNRSYSEPDLFSPVSASGIVLDLISRHFQASSRFKEFDASYFEKLASKIDQESFSTIEAANLILGLNSYARVSQPAAIDAVTIEGSKDGKNFSLIEIPAGKPDAINLATDINKIRISRSSRQLLFYQLFESGFDLPDSVIPENYGLEVNREFINSSGQATDSFKLGDDITVIIRIRSTAAKTSLTDISVVDIHPSGLEISGGITGMAASFNNNWYSKYIDVTEDRALIYGDLYQGAAEIKYKIKAVAKGKFILPPLQVDAMYDPRIFARTKASSIEIK